MEFYSGNKMERVKGYSAESAIVFHDKYENQVVNEPNCASRKGGWMGGAICTNEFNFITLVLLLFS